MGASYCNAQRWDTVGGWVLWYPSTPKISSSPGNQMIQLKTGLQYLGIDQTHTLDQRIVVTLKDCVMRLIDKWY